MVQQSKEPKHVYLCQRLPTHQYDKYDIWQYLYNLLWTVLNVLIVLRGKFIGLIKDHPSDIVLPNQLLHIIK